MAEPATDEQIAKDREAGILTDFEYQLIARIEAEKARADKWETDHVILCADNQQHRERIAALESAVRALSTPDQADLWQEKDKRIAELERAMRQALMREDVAKNEARILKEEAGAMRLLNEKDERIAELEFEVKDGNELLYTAELKLIDRGKRIAALGAYIKAQGGNFTGPDCGE